MSARRANRAPKGANLALAARRAGLTDHCYAVLAAVAEGRGSPVRAEAIAARVWPDGCRYRPADPVNGVRTTICRVREALAPHGIALRNRHGKGYWLENAARENRP